tara:strand:+ start:1066 stop:1977 length:912 start_codon:yes stop_codon:yes gene_type:complete
MKPYKSILILLLILTSCKSGDNLNGFWKLDFDQSNQSPSIAYELFFNEDTLYLTNENSFIYQTTYVVKNDSLSLSLSNGDTWKASFIKKSGLLVLGNSSFYKNDFRHFDPNLQYDLINFETDELLNLNASMIIIHLMKMNNKPQVRLNDVIKDLANIPEYINQGHRISNQPLALFVGKGVTYNDLLEVYKWLQISGLKEVTLITGYKGLAEFYIQQDQIRINQQSIDSFISLKNIPPVPQKTENKDQDGSVIEIQNSIDLERLQKLIHSQKYLIKIHERIDLLDYLKLSKIIEQNPNLQKEIK